MSDIDGIVANADQVKEIEGTVCIRCGQAYS